MVCKFEPVLAPETCVNLSFKWKNTLPSLYHLSRLMINTLVLVTLFVLAKNMAVKSLSCIRVVPDVSKPSFDPSNSTAGFPFSVTTPVSRRKFSAVRGSRLHCVIRVSALVIPSRYKPVMLPQLAAKATVSSSPNTLKPISCVGVVCTTYGRGC